MTTNPNTTPVIREVQANDLDALSTLRLEALRTEPAAFSRDYEAARKQSLEDWAAWLRSRSDGTSCVLHVAEVDDTLAGMAGIARPDSPKVSHSAFIWGVFVRPDFCRQAIGRRLIGACLDWAEEGGVEVVRLGVNSANPTAVGLYAACGFTVCGLSPKAMRIDGVSYDELMMVRMLPRA